MAGDEIELERSPYKEEQVAGSRIAWITPASNLPSELNLYSACPMHIVCKRWQVGLLYRSRLKMRSGMGIFEVL